MICRPTAEAESWGLSARSCTASSARRCEGAREEPTSNDLMWGTGPGQDRLLRHVPTGLHLCSWRGRAGNVLAHEPITGYWTENKCINNEEIFGACRVLLRSGLSKDHPHQNTHVLEELPNKHPLKLRTNAGGSWLSRTQLPTPNLRGRSQAPTRAVLLRFPPGTFPPVPPPECCQTHVLNHAKVILETIRCTAAGWFLVV